MRYDLEPFQLVDSPVSHTPLCRYNLLSPVESSVEVDFVSVAPITESTLQISSTFNGTSCCITESELYLEAHHTFTLLSSFSYLISLFAQNLNVFSFLLQLYKSSS